MEDRYLFIYKEKLIYDIVLFRNPGCFDFLDPEINPDREEEMESVSPLIEYDLFARWAFETPELEGAGFIGKLP